MSKTGVKTQNFTHIRDYNYEIVCGSAKTEYPIEYEIPRENTGYLRDQKYEDCVANVIAQISEAFWNKELGVSEKHSEYFIYGALRKDTSISPGMITSVAMDLWNQIGVVPQKYFDISEEMPEIKDIVKKFPEIFEYAKKYRIAGYVQLYNDNSIKDALTKYNRGLVAVSTKGFRGGSHCIMLTGWNDNKNKYKFKNSWGETYGDKGFSEIDKKEINYVYLPLFEKIVLPFDDVKESDWFSKPVKSVYFSGMMNGTSDNTFEPNRPITRAEVATIIDRIMKNVDDRFDLLDKLLGESVVSKSKINFTKKIFNRIKYVFKKLIKII